MFKAITLAALLVGPAAFAPALSAHGPTFDNPSTPVHHAPFSPLAPLVTVAGSTQIQTKDAATIAQKFKTRAAAAGPDFLSGAVSGAANWEAHTTAANDTYKQAVTAAAAANRFAKGVQGKGGKLVKNLQAVGHHHVEPHGSRRLLSHDYIVVT